VPTDGKYLFEFTEDIKDTGAHYMSYDLDPSTVGLLTTFATDQGSKQALVARLTSNKSGSFEALGACLGGAQLVVANQVSPDDVFSFSEGDTCNKK